MQAFQLPCFFLLLQRSHLSRTWSAAETSRAPGAMTRYVPGSGIWIAGSKFSGVTEWYCSKYGSWVRQHKPVLEFFLCYLLALWPWVDCLLSLNLPFPSTVAIIFISTSKGFLWGLNKDSETLKKWLELIQIASGRPWKSDLDVLSDLKAHGFSIIAVCKMLNFFVPASTGRRVSFRSP